jgi:hypothetical protein
MRNKRERERERERVGYGFTHTKYKMTKIDFLEGGFLYKRKQHVSLESSNLQTPPQIYFLEGVYFSYCLSYLFLYLKNIFEKF